MPDFVEKLCALPSPFSEANNVMHEVSEPHPIAFLSTARHYGKAADRLLSMHEPAIGSSPIYMLYFHAIESALKAFLAADGVSREDLKNRWRHKIDEMYEEAVKRGLRCKEKHKLDLLNVVNMVHAGNSEEAYRYYDHKSRPKPTLEYTSEMVNLLLDLVTLRIPHPKADAIKVEILFGKPY